jgi:uncharacterized protein (DUF983 family)
MATDQTAEVKRCTFAGAFLRGLRRRCPRCGEPGIFDGYFTLKERCPNCGFRFEREEGYWTGAMAINIGMCEVWFLTLFLTVVFVTMPDIAWAPLLAIALVTNGLLPILFYPLSKTIWMAFDVYYHSDEADDLI